MLYVSSAPFWLVALRRIKRTLTSRTVPLLAVFSALSFTIMMFNLPLPGGTTGHAVGMALAAIVLGPSFAILAISVALLIQALLFGDGGLTTFGANCFNMAVVGSVVSYAAYRLLALRADLHSPRRILAAGFAGYIGINAAALCAAIEFGIQPLYFHDSAGVPLYAPYPLSVTIPAMLLGHLTFAGLAEFVLSAGVVAYLQRSDPSLLVTTAPDAPQVATPAPGLSGAWTFGSKRLWLILGVLLVLTPIGILAGGSAWGEWRAADYASHETRRQIVAASQNHSLPSQVPSGLQRWSSLWTAPFSGYAPSFLRNAYIGYLSSAVIGVGVIILAGLLALRFVPLLVRRRSPMRKTFLERTILQLTRIFEESLFAEEIAQSRGFLQLLDPRVKLAGLAMLVGLTIAVGRLWMSVALFGLSILLAIASRISLVTIASRVWLPVLAFTGLIAVPALFITAGVTVWQVPFFDWRVTDRGLHAVAFLLLRTLTTTTFAFALVLATPWNQLLRAVRFFRIPVGVVAVLEMSYRYIFVLLRSAQDMFESRRARSLGPLSLEGRQQVAYSAAGTLLDKSLALSSDVWLAMQARGYRGEVRLLEDSPLAPASWFQLALLLVIVTLALYAGR